MYHGFPLLEETKTPDGWCFGAISGFDSSEGLTRGDAFVVAPDNTRAGIIWHVAAPQISVSLRPSADRWGVYVVGFDRKVCSRRDLVEQLQGWLPALKKRYEKVRHARNM